jgi:hypothetical protein
MSGWAGLTLGATGQCALRLIRRPVHPDIERRTSRSDGT